MFAAARRDLEREVADKFWNGVASWVGDPGGTLVKIALTSVQCRNLSRAFGRNARWVSGEEMSAIFAAGRCAIARAGVAGAHVRATRCCGGCTSAVEVMTAMRPRCHSIVSATDD